MTLRTKIIIPFAALLLFLIINFVYLYMYTSQSQQSIEKQIKNAQKVYGYTNRLNEIRLQGQNILLSFPYTRDEEALIFLQNSRGDVNKILKEIEPYLDSEESRSLLQEYDNSRKPIPEARTAFVEASRNGDMQQTAEAFRTWQGYSQKSTDILAKLTANNVAFMENSSLLYKDLSTTIYYLTLALTSLIILFLLVLVVYLRNIITKPIQKIASAAEDVSHGQFNTVIDIHSDDELGMLAKSLDKMSVNLKKYYKNLQNEVKQKESVIKKNKIFEEQKDNFISMASHELKTPVTSLKVYEQLMFKKATAGKDKEYMMYLKKMDEQIGKLTSLITNLLDLSKIQAGRIPFEMKLFDLNPILKDIIALSNQTHKKHRITLKGKIDKKVYGDEDRITQVLNNLLSNAVKYSPDSKDVHVMILNSKKHTKIIVQDFGIGIDKKNQTKIFDRFFRVDTDNGITFPGLGIGLFISSEIVKRHGGVFEVKSQKNKGSTFSFTLPYKGNE